MPFAFIRRRRVRRAAGSASRLFEALAQSVDRPADRILDAAAGWAPRNTGDSVTSVGLPQRVHVRVNAAGWRVGALQEPENLYREQAGRQRRGGRKAAAEVPFPIVVVKASTSQQERSGAGIDHQAMKEAFIAGR